jgi:hypothetical protein
MQVHETKATTDTDEATYRASVEKCIAASASASDALWVIADEACTVTKVYGENRLNQFALDINWPGSPCTLGRMRPVARAFPKSGARPRFLSSAQVLQKHGDRIKIVTENSDISKRDAQAIMRKWRAEQAGTATPDQPDEEQAEGNEAEEDLFDEGQPEEDNPTEKEDTAPTSAATTATPAKGAKAKGAKATANKEQKPEWSRDISGWFNNQVKSVNGVIAELNKIMANCTPEQHELLGTLEWDLLLEAFQNGVKKSAKVGDWVSKPWKEAAAELTREVRVRITPAPKPARRASTPVQPEA